MKFDFRMLPVVALVLGTSGVVVAQGHGPYQPASNSSAAAYAQDYGHHDDWDSPPPEFREIQRQGYHDGVEGISITTGCQTSMIVTSTSIPMYRKPTAMTIARDSGADTTRR
jgi:hypothetical protein